MKRVVSFSIDDSLLSSIKEFQKKRNCSFSFALRYLLMLGIEFEDLGVDKYGMSFSDYLISIFKKFLISEDKKC